MSTPGPWQTPKRPGPRRSHAIGALLLAVVALLTWAVFGSGRLAWSSLDTRGTVELRVDDDGVATATGAHIDSRKIASAHGVPYLVVRATVDDRVTKRVEHLRVRTALPGGIEGGDASLRAIAPGAEVTRQRDDHDGSPELTIRRPTSVGHDVQLVLVGPVDTLLPSSKDGIDDLPTLDSATRGVDDDARDAATDSRRARWIREHAWWLAGLLAALSAGGPFLAWRRARIATFGTGVATRGAIQPAATAGVPTNHPAVEVAALNSGAERVDPGDALAAHVLDAVASERWGAIRLDWSQEGAGTTVRPPEEPADPLDAAAAGLARAFARGETSGTAWLADAPRIGASPDTGRDPDELRTARTTWRRALDELDARFVRRGVHQPWRTPTAIVAASAAALLVLAVLCGLLVSTAWVTALAWLVAAVMLVAATVLGASLRDRAGWARVADRAVGPRSSWLAWRRALVAGGAADGSLPEARSRPHAVAMGLDLADQVSRPPAGAVGSAAIADDTIAALRRIGRGTLD